MSQCSATRPSGAASDRHAACPSGSDIGGPETAGNIDDLASLHGEWSVVPGEDRHDHTIYRDNKTDGPSGVGRGQERPAR
jgi:hypothetical protein